MTLLYRLLCQPFDFSESAFFWHLVTIIWFILVFEDAEALTKTGGLLCITPCTCKDSSAQRDLLSVGTEVKTHKGAICFHGVMEKVK